MGLHSKCVIEGPPNTMVMFEYGIDQEARSPPVKQTCSVEEGGPAWTTPTMVRLRCRSSVCRPRWRTWLSRRCSKS